MHALNATLYIVFIPFKGIPYLHPSPVALFMGKFMPQLLRYSPLPNVLWDIGILGYWEIGI